MSERGRPTDYKEEFAGQAHKLCLLGATDKDLADFFEVCEATINNWKLAHNDFLESVRAGKVVADMEVAKSLYDGTQDRTVIEQQAFKLKEIIYGENGKKIKEVEKVEIIDLQKTIPSDFRNQQFWLKNRKSEQWKDKQEIENTHHINDLKSSNSQLFKSDTDTGISDS